MSYQPPDQPRPGASQRDPRRRSNERVFDDDDDEEEIENPRTLPEQQDTDAHSRHHRRQSQNAQAAYHFTRVTQQESEHPSQAASWNRQGASQPHHASPAATVVSPAMSARLPVSPNIPSSGLHALTGALHAFSMDDQNAEEVDDPGQQPAYENQGRHFDVTTRTDFHENDVQIEHRINNTNGIRTSIMRQPMNRITDPYFLQHEVPMQGMVLPNASGDREDVLFPSFQVRQSGFFRLGRVLTVLWSEPAGANSLISDVIPEDRAANAQSGLSLGQYGEVVFSKVRRFVIIRENTLFSTALPINSYGYRGVGKPGVRKSDHSIIYIGREAPSPSPLERPQRGEFPMRPIAIKVIPDANHIRLHRMSRLDFGKPHTIHHNIKVASVGMVHKDSIGDLLTQFQNVWNLTPIAGPSMNTSTVSSMSRPTLPQQNQSMMQQPGSQVPMRQNQPPAPQYTQPTPQQAQYAAPPGSTLPQQAQQAASQQNRHTQRVFYYMQTYMSQGYSREQARDLLAQHLMTQGYTQEQAYVFIMNCLTHGQANNN